MENKKVESPTVAQPKVEEISPKVTKQPKKKKSWLIILVVVLSVLLLLVGGYIIYTEFFKESEDVQTEVEETETDESEDLEDEDTDTGVCEVGDEDCEDDDTLVVTTEDDGYTTFEGEVIFAELPEGWSVIEYFDGDGTESLPDMGTGYYGLTAIDIINPDSLQVFSIQAVSGIGFAGCPSYALFDDDNPSYKFEQESMSADMGETLNVTDYTGEDYIEFEFLGVTFRRIDDSYFYDTKEGNNYFEPPCVEGLLTLEGLYFTDGDEYKYEAYFYGSTEDAAEDDLPIVDEILESIELI